MIYHSFHINRFSIIREFTYNSLTTMGYLKLFCVLISPTNLCSSLKQAQYSYKEEEVYVFPESTLVFLQRLQWTNISAQLFSRRIYNRTRRSNYPPKRTLNFPPKRLTHPPKRFFYPPKSLSCKGFPRERCKSKLCSMQSRVWASVVCHALWKSGFEICGKYRPKSWNVAM